MNKDVPVRNRRSRNTRSQRRKILLLVDGKSEKRYFGQFTGKDSNLKLIPLEHGKSGLNKIIPLCIAKIRDNGINVSAGDEAYIVTDYDNRYALDDLLKYEKDCRDKGISLILSNPSFEVWLLLHFRAFRCS